MAQPSVVINAPRNRRTVRRPQHRFQLRHRPWQIQPFLLAPVLPGETMKNLLLQSRVVTDPIKNPLIGWWIEYYIFYVKHRDLYQRDKLTEMVLNPEADLSTLDSATKVEHYHTNGTDLAINWVDMCLNRVVDEYFRVEGETAATATIGNLPAANINFQAFFESAIDNADFVTPADENLSDAGSEFGAAVHVSEVERALRQYELMRSMQLTDMTYEDFLSTYGVKPKPEEAHVPELLRYIREWSYPTNTVDPANGTPSSAVSWSIAERADKDRFFREPGFIFGVTVARPKVYLKNLTSNASMLLRDAYRWLPAVMADDPATSLIKVTASDPPLDANTDAYWVDVKDLFLYGDQFVNFALTETNANIVALPAAALSSAAKLYASAADADALFTVPLTANQVRQDGIVSIAVASTLTDTSPMGVGTNKTV